MRGKQSTFLMNNGLKKMFGIFLKSFENLKFRFIYIFGK